jgi:hypothetical protein
VALKDFEVNGPGMAAVAAVESPGGGAIEAGSLGLQDVLSFDREFE